MSWKRLVALSGLLLALAVLGLPTFAQEPPPGTEPKPATGEKPAEEVKPAEQAQPAEEAPKTHWWGDRFSLYIEANTGAASMARDIDTSISTSAQATSQSGLDIDALDHGRLAVGWKLPAERGMLQVMWTGYRETSYSFEAVGSEKFALLRIDGEITNQASRVEMVPWWNVFVEDGHLQARQSIPILEEDGTITYEYDNPDLNTTLENEIADTLQNNAQTLDLLYQREFGGRTFRGRWSAGLRFFSYQGTVPAAAWLNDADYGGIGYTEGTYIRLIPLAEKTSGIGPTGSMEAQYRLFRNRLTFYLQGRVAFVVQDLESDTGDFYTLVSSAADQQMYPVPSRLNESRDKTSWQVTAEAGVRWRILEGFQFELAGGQTSYQDCVLVPTSLLIPKLVQEAPRGTSALYNTRDFLVGSWRAGFSYQF